MLYFGHSVAPPGRHFVTPQERQRMNELCTRIQEELDPTKLTALVDELNDLLGKKDTPARVPHAQKSA